MSGRIGYSRKCVEIVLFGVIRKMIKVWFSPLVRYPSNGCRKTSGKFVKSTDRFFFWKEICNELLRADYQPA